MKILILGHKYHGKTTLANELAYYGFSFTDTSDMLIKLALETNFDARPMSSVHSLPGVYAHKDAHRAWLVDSLAKYNADDKTKFARRVLEASDVYCGMRSSEEFVATAHLFDAILYVQDESKPAEGHMQIAFDKTHMHLISNSGRRLGLEKQVKQLVCSWAAMSMAQYDVAYGTVQDRIITNFSNVPTLEGTGSSMESLLRRKGFSVQHKNNGMHVVADNPAKLLKVEYWPTTGKTRVYDATSSTPPSTTTSKELRALLETLPDA